MYRGTARLVPPLLANSCYERFVSAPRSLAVQNLTRLYENIQSAKDSAHQLRLARLIVAVLSAYGALLRPGSARWKCLGRSDHKCLFYISILFPCLRLEVVNRFRERQPYWLSTMSDPLSIASGVVGIITAAGHISFILTQFTKRTIAAPHQAKIMLSEVDDISGILSQLQSFLLGQESPDRSRAALLRVQHAVAIVSSCVLTFSELEKLLDDFKTGKWDILDRLIWAKRETAIVDLIQRLQNHKASLSLVLNILNGFVPSCQILFCSSALMFQQSYN